MPIPLKLREKMASDGSMLHCIHQNSDCSGKVEWEHCWLYAGKQIQEEWAIIPCCTYHHRGAGLDKDFNRWHSLLKAIKLNGGFLEVICKYPKKEWLTIWKYLNKKYENY